VVLERTVDSLLPDWPSLPPAERVTVGHHCSTFVRRQISRAPAHIRLGFWGLFAVFVTFAALRSIGRGSFAASADAAALTAFAALGPAAFAGLERILRSMTVLAFLEHPAVLSAIGEEGGDR
jgi:hypothetical protein